MKNIVLYVICFTLLLLSCNRKAIHSADNSDSCKSASYIIEDSINKDTIFIEEDDFDYSFFENDSIQDAFLTQEKREELIAFCDLFIASIQSNNIEKIKEVIVFPMWVECFKDWTYGDTITTDNFYKYRKRIFDDTFFKSMKEYRGFLNREIGKDTVCGMGASFFIIYAHYFFELPEEYKGTLDGKKTRIFRFEKRDDKYKFMLVFCAG